MKGFPGYIFVFFAQIGKSPDAIQRGMAHGQGGTGKGGLGLIQEFVDAALVGFLATGKQA